jgi:UDP-2-acetamido-3-amino-2,3-dideoxy-glucuronate N-acetyltransferase
VPDAANRFFAHDSAFVDDGARVGADTRIWHFCHVMSGAVIGERCNLGQNVHIADDVRVGNNVKMQNNVSLYSGTEIEDDVFLGPSCVFTNVTNPRAEIIRHGLYERTRVRRGATIGANATIVCGVEIGRYAFVAAGAVVTSDVPDYALMIGTAAKRVAWMSRHGHRLVEPDAKGVMTCPESGFRYSEQAGVLRCLDLDEDAPLSAEQAQGTVGHDELKRKRESR